MKQFSMGQAVTHEDSGDGSVVYTRELNGKHLILVEFEDGYPTEVPEEELK